jgi:hypothetical protein
MVRTSTRSGGVRPPSPVSLLVSLAIANVKKRFKAEHAKVKRAEKATKKMESDIRRHERQNEELAKLRRKDAEVVKKLLDVGRCGVRLKLRSLFPYVRNDFMPLEEKREAMRTTSWVFCKECDAATEGCDGWRRPFGIRTPEDLEGSCRHVPYCVHNGARPGRKGAPFAFRDLETLLPPTEYLPDPPDANLYHKLLKKESRLMLPRLGCSGVVAPSPPPLLLPEPAMLDEPLPPPPPTFPKCQRKLCQQPPTPDHALTSTNVVCKVSERDYNLETPLKRALRQKAHSHKNVLGMNDVIFYKHMRDHNLEPAEAHAEVLNRKRLVHAGRGSTYEAPEMGHLVLGLLNGVPVEDPCPPPPLPNPWQAHLKQHPVAKAGLVAALEAF